MSRSHLKVIDGGLSPRRLDLSAGPNLDKELKRLRRRVTLLNALREGEATLVKQTVRPHWVKRHRRDRGYRMIIKMRGDK